MNDHNTDNFGDSPIVVIAMYIYFIGVPVTALLFFIDAIENITGVLSFILQMIIASFKAFLWPITIWL
jgi:uncharacterized membrane protein